jgi:hypothetical protein
MACSADTMVRLVRRAALPTPAPVKVLGVDEWAWRKGQSYGTLLVDLERHVPVDVLPDASADSFAAWLKAHPSVELITRDRAGVFADGAASGAPNAIQIADRWHILRNLSEALKKVLARHHETLKRAFTPQQEQEPAPAVPAPAVISHDERIRQSRRDRRLARYQEVRKLHEQGWSFASIARMLGMNKKTVAKFVQAEQFPEARPRGDRRRKLTPYLPYLRKQWEAGEHNAAKLHRDIQAQGCAWLRNDDPCVSVGTARPERAAHRASPASSTASSQEIALAARHPLESPSDLVDPESAGAALRVTATRSRSCPGGTPRSDHRLSAGPVLRPVGSHTERESVRPLDRTGPREWSARTGQFCRRDPTRPICGV